MSTKFLSLHSTLHLLLRKRCMLQQLNISGGNDACWLNIRIKLKDFKESGNRGHVAALGPSEKGSSGLDSGAFTTKVKDQSASKTEAF